MSNRHVAVMIVGGGPAGLSAAVRLAPAVEGDVVVLDRERETGGIPRHSDHTGYGIRDLRRLMRGPAYARHLTAAARDAGAELMTQTMATSWAGDRTLRLTSPEGRLSLTADAVVLATGARERPRSARRIPGDRPEGVYTTGQLQNLVHGYHRAVGERAVVVGAELVSWSAVLTLRESGCRTVLMTTAYDKSESYAAFRLLGRSALRVPVASQTRVVRINGRERVESVELENVRTGARRTVACDTVVTTGDWIPDHELARTAGLDLDPATLGPTVDMALRMSRPGIFGAGNLLHPVDTADVAALDGSHVVGAVLDWLAGTSTADRSVRIVADAPLRWVAPQVLRPGDSPPARERLLLWSDEIHNLPHVEARQDARLIGARRLVWPAAPGRVFRVPFSLVADADPTGGDVHITLRV